MRGYEGNRFKPNQHLARAEAVVILKMEKNNLKDCKFYDKRRLSNQDERAFFCGFFIISNVCFLLIVLIYFAVLSEGKKLFV